MSTEKIKPERGRRRAQRPNAWRRALMYLMTVR